ncbi:TrbC/VirB2 family protein [Sphingomonas sp. VNH70]|uniref:TrbC/VirB2 family protein n=1 Tax=Sphingomonas silueang TaxID=3156617 RepID=UPI0032B53882
MSVASLSLADPNGGQAIITAARWLQDALIGTVATTLAVLAVAGIGFLLLTGRLHLRRGSSVLLGCFLLFGAPVIAAGLLGDREETVVTVPAPPVASPTPLPRPMPLASPSAVFDPYAGAAVPTG